LSDSRDGCYFSLLTVEVVLAAGFDSEGAGLLSEFEEEELSEEDEVEVSVFESDLSFLSPLSALESSVLVLDPLPLA
jgi:hypothetical protein